MGKGPTPVSKTGMLLPQLKQVLAKASPENPIGGAFGIGEEPSLALLMMHQSKSGKAMLKELEETFPDAKNTRYANVVIDPAQGDVVKFYIAKTVTGMAKRLTKTLKGSGYKKVEILLEDGTVIEGATDDEDAPLGTAPTETVGGPPAPPPPPPPPSKPAYDANQLRQMLTALAQRIQPVAGANAALLAQLSGFAREADTNIKTNNLTYAATAIGQLKSALDKAAASPAPWAAQFAKSRDDWAATYQAITAEIDKLRAELVATYKDSGIAADVETRYREKVAPVLTAFEEDLAHTLDEAGKTADPATHTRFVGEARAIMGRFAGALANPVIADLDSNPFVPLSIKATVGTRLKELAATVK